MIGAIEILIILIIFGIIYGKDAIDKTFRKRPDESVVESLAVDVKDFYQADPKRMYLIVGGAVCFMAFLGVFIYWAFTNYDIPKMLGFE